MTHEKKTKDRPRSAKSPHGKAAQKKQPTAPITPPRAKSRPARVRAKHAKPLRAGRIAIIGRPNVGKSTLLNALLGERIAITSHHPQTTRDNIAGIVTTDDTQFVFVDTPGLHNPQNALGKRMNAFAKGEAEQSDLRMFLVAADPKGGPAPADIDLLKQLEAPVILVINKIDKFLAKDALFPLLQSWSEAHTFVAIIPISARKKDGIQALLHEVALHLPEGPFLFPEDEISDKPIRFFVAEFVRERLLHAMKEEVPHGIAVTVDRFEEGGKVPHLDVTIHVDKESHKGMVIGKGGSVLKSVGAEARHQIEKLMGQQIMLKLAVRVTSRWYASDALLTQLGYES